MNFADYLTKYGTIYPGKDAIIIPRTSSTKKTDSTRLTYRQVLSECDALAHGLTSIGITRGMRVSFMVRPGLDFLPLSYALLKIGAVPVLIDPGMGRKNLLRCVAQVEPDVFIGIPMAHVLRLVFPAYFRSVSINITLGKRLFWGGYRLPDLREHNAGSFQSVEVDPDDPAMIIFTTGSTGPPKGVVYTHAMFDAQKCMIEERYKITPDDIDMPGFAMFAIFSVAMGMTVILPEMDPTRPADVDPEKIIHAIETYSVTFSFGSPALWNTVSRYCIDHDVRLPTLRRILMAGAPVPWYLHERLLGKILSEDSEIYTPYGATEALLTTSFEGSQVLAETMELTRGGKGYCVGFPYGGMTVKIIDVSDQPIRTWCDAAEKTNGEIGEIVVKGPVVSREYYKLPDQNDGHKIYESDDRVHGAFWHRIGDLGYFDVDGRLWFCGRKAHRVETSKGTLYTVCCEAIFNEHPDVYRSALVGIGKDRRNQTPVIIVEPVKGRFPESKDNENEFKQQLMARAGTNAATRDIGQVLFHRDFPVDIRHNAKIFREKLAVWAESSVKS